MKGKKVRIIANGPPNIAGKTIKLTVKANDSIANDISGQALFN
jgi:hypothetical protein